MRLQGIHQAASADTFCWNGDIRTGCKLRQVHKCRRPAAQRLRKQIARIDERRKPVFLPCRKKDELAAKALLPPLRPKMPYRSWQQYRRCKGGEHAPYGLWQQYKTACRFTDAESRRKGGAARQKSCRKYGCRRMKVCFPSRKGKCERQQKPRQQLPHGADHLGHKQRQPGKRRPCSGTCEQAFCADMPPCNGCSKAQQHKIHQKIVE